MADVRTLSGAEVERGAFQRDEDIAEMLVQLTADNDAGLLQDFAHVEVLRSGAVKAAWCFGKSTGQTAAPLIGGATLLVHELCAASASL